MSSIVRLAVAILWRLAALSGGTVRTKAGRARETMLKWIAELEDLHLAEERLVTPAKLWSHRDLEADEDLLRPGARPTADARPPTG